MALWWECRALLWECTAFFGTFATNEVSPEKARAPMRRPPLSALSINHHLAHAVRDNVRGAWKWSLWRCEKFVTVRAVHEGAGGS